MNNRLQFQVENTCRRLFSEINRDPTSNSYGCFDRRYWAWKLTDFPEATFQRNLSALGWYLRQQNSKNQSQFIIEIIKSGLEFAFKIQHRDGSFDQAYPHEHSYGATGFLLPDLINAFLAIKSDCSNSEILFFDAGFRKAADFLTNNSEQHSLISNHLAGAIFGLFKAGELLNNDRYSEKGQELLDSLISKQSTEGWYPEYGGADPGYQTLCMHYLAQIYKLKPYEGLRKSLELSLDFLKYFAQPDGTFGGEYGSRRTEIYYPGGIALLAHEFSAAASLHKFMLASIETGKTVTLTDIDMGNTAPLLNSSILALESGILKRDVPVLAFQEENLNKDFPIAGVAIRSRPTYHLILGASNGGVTKIFEKKSGKLVFDDCGIYGVTEEGEKITTQSTQRDNPMHASNDTLECESNLYKVKDTTPGPFNYLVLRMMNLTLMRIGFLNEIVKKLMVSLLVKNTSHLNLSRTRNIKLNTLSINISDTLTTFGKVRLKRLSQGFKFTAIHMASARYFTPAQENPPQMQILDHATLNHKGSLHIKQHVSFNDGTLKQSK